MAWVYHHPPDTEAKLLGKGDLPVYDLGGGAGLFRFGLLADEVNDKARGLVKEKDAVVRKACQVKDHPHRVFPILAETDLLKKPVLYGDYWFEVRGDSCGLKVHVKARGFVF